MVKHISSLNYYPFGDSLREMAETLRMTAYQPSDEARGIITKIALKPHNADGLDNFVAESSIKAFVKVRDMLTHQGRFLVPDENPEIGWTSERVNEERIRQLHFMQRFAAAYLASALGWIQTLAPPPPLWKQDGAEEIISKPQNESSAE